MKLPIEQELHNWKMIGKIECLLILIGNEIRILSGEIMWINKEKYEHLNRMAEDNEYDARMFRDLVKYIKEKKTVFYCDFVMMSRDTWDEVSNKCSTSDDRIKDIEAELEWYKVKYHEMKMNVDT